MMMNRRSLLTAGTGLLLLPRVARALPSSITVLSLARSQGGLGPAPAQLPY